MELHPRLSDSGVFGLLSLTFTSGMGAEQLIHYLESGYSPDDYAAMSGPEALRATGLRYGAGNTNLSATIDFARRRASEEMAYMLRAGARPTFITDPEYPFLLRESANAPAVIFTRGECPAAFSKSLSVVGTRHATQYGLSFVNSLIEELSASHPDLYVVSGLAYGIDACAHTAAMRHNLGTIAVVAHGLDTIYPAQHHDMADAIVATGGCILTEYPSGTRPFRPNFLRRNRIIAGLTEATLVAESDVRGGAMSTARAAFASDREVLALPGRATDRFSSGCNKLVQDQIAHLVTSASDVCKAVGWKSTVKRQTEAVQTSLFAEMTPQQQAVVEAIRSSAREVSADELNSALHIPLPKLATMLFELEINGIIAKYPGDRYGMATGI